MTFRFLYPSPVGVNTLRETHRLCTALRAASTQPIRMEHRNRVRYRLAASAVFAWRGADRARLVGEGTTRDISLAGVFILSPTCPPVGVTIQLDVFLSSLVPSTKRGVRIKTEATVTRVDHAGSVEGFAAVSRNLKLIVDSNGETVISVPNENDLNLS